jgi:putative mRNA 3-end processing factor
VAGSPRIKRQDAAPVSWRDGIHLTGTAIWCDAKRSRDICFVSAASALRHAKHGQLIGSQQTLSLLDKPGGQAASQLAVPFGQPFTLGTQRIELFSSGHAYGAASLLVHANDARVVYAGAIHPGSEGLGEGIDHRSADVLVLSAPYGQQHFVFEDSASVAEELTLRCQEVCAAGGVAVLLVGGIGKALDTASLLEEAGLPLFAHHSIHEVCSAMQRKGEDLPAPKRWKRDGKGGRTVLWPLALCHKVDTSELPATSQVILVSGRAIDKESVAASGAHQGFAWSNQADHNELLQYIRDSGAKQVFLTHSVDRGLALASKLPGVSVEAIGPPEQLSLF